VLDNNNQEGYVFKKIIKSQHNKNLIYWPLVMRMKMISQAATMIQRVNDFEAFVMPSESMPAL